MEYLHFWEKYKILTDYCTPCHLGGIKESVQQIAGYVEFMEKKIAKLNRIKKLFSYLINILNIKKY